MILFKMMYKCFGLGPIKESKLIISCTKFKSYNSLLKKVKSKSLDITGHFLSFENRINFLSSEDGSTLSVCFLMN